MNKQKIISIVIILSVILIDQLTKYGFFALVDENGGTIEVLPFFNLVKVYNTGVSFGMGGSVENSHLIFSLLALAIVAVLCYFLFKEENKWHAYAYSLIIGGAIGNIIDRVLIGGVMDFLDFHAYGYHWPAFNVADSTIFIGVAVLIFIPATTKNLRKES